MPLVDIKREIRRRRILENIDERLHKISGKNKYIKDKNPSAIIEKNVYIGKENYAEETHENKEIFASNIEFCQPFMLHHSNPEDSFQENWNDTSKSVDYISTLKSENQILYNLFKHLFLSSLSYIFLATFINILFIVNIDCNLYKSIFIPYIVLITVHIFFRNEKKEIQGSNIIVTTLTLCNFKPEIVYRLNKIFILCNEILNNFTIYLTSFVLFNWVAFMWFTTQNYIQFM